jgi:hypothetical protein
MSVFDEEPPQSKFSSTGKFIVLGLILLGLAGIGFLYFTRGTGETERAVAPAPVPTPTTRTPSTDIPEFAPLTGSLEVSANVEGATVYLDGETLGAAPARRDEIPNGRHSVRVEAQGFRTFERTVNIEGGREAQVQALLQAAPVGLRVESDVPGAQVFVDRRYIGTTPLTVDDLGPGTYEVTVSAEGYDMQAETVKLGTEPRDLFVKFKEVRLQESVDVIHKHGFGSCSGKLVANADGIQYQTDHKDAFFVPYNKLESFEMDYTDNNLKLKIRGGRNYNFEEKNGNADALFVFHRNVDAARKRLAENQ